METKNEPKKYCPRCKSDQIVKDGKHTYQKGVVQRYQCKLCGTSFSNDGYYRGKYALSLVQYVGVLYQQGLSYEKIQTRIKRELGIDISRSTIGAWIEKLGIQPRKGSGDQKNKVVRELVEVGVVTVVRQTDTFHPERFVVLDNFVGILEGQEESFLHASTSPLPAKSLERSAIGFDANETFVEVARRNLGQQLLKKEEVFSPNE